MTLNSSKVLTDVFLQNDYLSLGVNAGGSLGTVAKAPSGFITSGFTRTGLVADTDGFGTGSAKLDDAMLLGTPIEGFSVGYDIGSTNYVKTNQDRNSIHEIDGVSSTSSTSTEVSAQWIGTTSEKLKIDQVITLTEDAQYYAVTVTLTNTSSSDMTDVRYFRTIDPDHTGFSTLNKIVDQGDGKALVTASSSSGANPLFMYADDARAVVSTYGQGNKDPYNAYAYDKPQAEGYSIQNDQSININFALGTLEAGETTSLTFYMGVTADLGETIKAIDALDGGPAPVPENSAPVAFDDSLTLKQDSDGTGNVLANDKDADGNTLSASLLTGPAHGTVTLSKDGSYIYTPDDGYYGSDTFSYKVSDGKASDTGTVKLSITQVIPQNTAPVAVDDSLTLSQDSNGAGNVLLNDTDADNDALSTWVVFGPSHGKVTLGKDGNFVYTPDAGYYGSDSFTYKVSDGESSDYGKVRITVDQVIPENKAPVAVNDSLLLDQDSKAGGNVLTNDSDADGDAIYAWMNSGPSHGTVTFTKDGNFVYTPDAGYHGEDSFTYKVSDGEDTDVGTVRINVAEVKPEPAPEPEPVPVPPPGGGTTLPSSALLNKAGTLDGSSSSNQTLVGASHHNAFYFGTAAAETGADRISNFGKDDIFVVDKMLYDGNKDGKVGFSSNTVRVDLPNNTSDSVQIDGVNALRYLGTQDGLFVYGDHSVRPMKAIEGMLGNDLLSGDRLDSSSQTFFYDTALDMNLGNDEIVKFGEKDVLVTTSQLFDGNGDGIIKWKAGAGLGLSGGSGAYGDKVSPGEGGSLVIKDTGGAELTALEYDGMVKHNGQTYYVYSQLNSDAGTDMIAWG